MKKTMIAAAALLMATSVFAAPQWQQPQRADYHASYRVSQRSGFLSGVVRRIDYRSGTFTLRENGSGRLIRVALPSLNRTHLRSGEFVRLTGDWERGNIFAAYRIDNPRGGRY